MCNVPYSWSFSAWHTYFWVFKECYHSLVFFFLKTKNASLQSFFRDLFLGFHALISSTLAELFLAWCQELDRLLTNTKWNILLLIIYNFASVDTSKTTFVLFCLAILHFCNTLFQDFLHALQVFSTVYLCIWFLFPKWIILCIHYISYF